jgi:predicted RND superfamily exporter protein
MNNNKKHESNNFLSRFFEKWGEVCFNNPKIILALSIMLIAALSSQALKVRVDISTEAMLRENDPARLNYKEFRKTFGREDVIVLSLPTGGQLNSDLFFNLNELHNVIEEKTPNVNKITSLLNARYSYGENNDLFVEELLEGFPNHKWDYTDLQAYVLAQPAYINRLISEDGEFVALIVELQTYMPGTDELLGEKQSAEVYEALRQLLDARPELNIAMSGEPVLLSVTNTLTAEDSAIVGVTVLTMLIVFMAFFFRRISGVLMPMVVIYGSILGGVGLMGFFGAPYTMTSNALVPLILGIGVADVVHILSIFYKSYDKSGDKKEAILYAMSHSAPAVFLTTLTTAIGFMSFLIGDLASTAELGIYAACTVAFALFFTITLLPAFISIFDIKRKEANHSENKKITQFLLLCGEAGIKYPRIISFSAILSFLLCLWGMTSLSMSFNPIGGFPDTLLAKQDNLKIDKQYSGITNFEVVIDSGKSNGIYEKAFLEKLFVAEKELSNSNIAGLPLSDTYSILDIIREVNKSLNGNDSEYYTVPDDRELIAQEVLLFELSQAEDLFDVIDVDKRKIRLSLKTIHADGVEYEAMIRDVEKILRGIFDEENEILITGSSALVAESVPKAIKTMIKSYMIAAVLIILILMILVGSFRIGMISILPNLLPIALAMYVMVLIGWPINMSTIMVGAIAMGLVVDDSLHFLYQVKKEFVASGDIRFSIRTTLRTVGPALVMTTVIFTSSMLVELGSSIFPVFAFGATMAMIAVFALLSDILIAPALLTLVYGGKEKGELEKS